jgi:methionyl-tRNA synthetase
VAADAYHGPVWSGAGLAARPSNQRKEDRIVEEQQPPRPTPEKPAAQTEAEAKPLPIDRFMELDLRVARIEEAARIPNADRLLKLRVDLGGESRQLVAGIAAVYEPEALIGKRIIVVANLKPARLRGVLSEGMLLAADLGGKPILATFDEPVEPGTRVR